MKKILIGVPCYNEEGNIEFFLEALLKTLNKITNFQFEIIFLDDGSIDNTWKVIKKLNINNNNYKINGIKFSRNFGKEIAIKCLLERAESYDHFITIDSDLQHPPELIEDLINILSSTKNRIVLTKKTNKNSKFLRLYTTKIFYYIFNLFSEFKLINGLSDFSIIDNKVVRTINSFKNNIFIFKTALQSVGYKPIIIEFDIEEREKGKSNFNFVRLIGYAFQTIYTYNSPFIIKFNLINLSFVILFSVFLSLISFFILPHLLTNIFIFFIFLMIFWITISIMTITIYLVFLTKEIDRKPIYIIDEEV